MNPSLPKPPTSVFAGTVGTVRYCVAVMVLAGLGALVQGLIQNG